MLSQHFGCSRFVYNYFLQYKTDQYKKTKKSATWIQMSRELTKMKRLQEFVWLNQVSRQSVANSIKNLDVAFNSFFKKESKYPKFKKRHNRQSFKISSFFCKIHSDGIHIPLIDILKCDLSGLPDDYELTSVTVSRDTTGKYWVSISYKIEIPDPIIDESKPIIGIDFGLRTFITTSNGNKIDHPKPLKNQRKKQRRLNRSLVRSKKGSNRRKILKKKLAIFYERIRNKRVDFLHKLSSKMIRENQAITLEDLNLKGMMNRFGKSIQDLGWNEFTRQLEYKGKWYGCIVIKVDRFFPSSKICSSCGYVHRDLQLGDEKWVCPKCLEEHDRDINAAKNILNYNEYGGIHRNQRAGRAGSVRPLKELSKAKS